MDFGKKLSIFKTFFLILILIGGGFLLSSLLPGCKFFHGVEEVFTPEPDYDSKITAVKLNQNTINIINGESEYIKLALTPNENQGKCHVSWEYDKNFVEAKTDNFGAIINAINPGSTFIKATCNGIIATCIIHIEPNGEESFANPYIYSNDTVIQIQPNQTYNIIASLYGGSISDMEDFSWSIEDNSIAEITYARNNCVVTAKKSGSTKITCSHPNAQYDYTFIVFVYKDKLTETYITTNYNVITLDKNSETERNVSVDLINPVSASYKNGFEWHYADEESKDIIQFNSNLNNAVITPLKNGVAKIVVTHEDAQYPLEIIVRVTTIVKNVYINVSQSTVVLQDSETPFTVTANIQNYEGYANPDEFTWTFPENYETFADCSTSGNTLRIVGKKNGTFKIKVSHPLSEYSRNILVVLQNQIGSAVDASMYITTDQNYIQTQVGSEPITVNIRLVGGIDGEDNVGDDTQNFTWYIKDGRNNGYVEVQQITGSIKDLSSRSAVSSGNSCPAQLVIKPLKAGDVTIVVTHPRCLYDTEIQVKIFSEDAVVNPKTVTTEDSVIRILNGCEKQVTAILRNHNAGDENLVTWTSADSSIIEISGSPGRTAVLHAIGSGSHQTYVTVHLDGALSDKKILILSADTEAELSSMKCIYSDSTYLRISEGETKELLIDTIGLSASDRISWSSDNPSICTVSGNSTIPNNSKGTITAVSQGNTTITAYLDGCQSVIFDVTVLPEGVSSEIYDENAGYMTTRLNAVVLENVGDSVLLSIEGVNISEHDLQLHTKWEINDLNPDPDNPVFSLSGNPGKNITLSSNKPGKSNIKVTNKYSANSLNISAKCGELYEWTDNYIIYITTEEDVINIKKGDVIVFGASLVNTNQTGSFSWAVENDNGSGKNDFIEITGLSGGTCNIKAIEAGQTVLTINNTLCPDITKEVLVNVANSDEEIKGFRYLSTKNNVVAVGQGQTVSVSVEMKNSDELVLSGYNWLPQNPSICSVAFSGSVATIKGETCGTTKIVVSNDSYCNYDLEIIVNVVDPILAAENPYISCNNIVTCVVGESPVTVAAELVGGKESDNMGFRFTLSGPDIISLNYANNSAQIKAVKEGVTQVIVSHSNPSVISRSILVICEPKPVNPCYISVPESIIKMKPSDAERTITASLINGSGGDEYDFKWWSDDYSKINMNYSGNSCIIEPISSGIVTIHCSHPKAVSVKDIILYISEYNEFAFSQNSIELVSGDVSFINMEVPATSFDSYITYTSTDNNICYPTGNNSVCTLTAGSVTGSSKYCTIKAVLHSKGGGVQAEASLSVSVSKKDNTRPFIVLTNPNKTIIDGYKKGDTISLSAKINGTTSDTTFSGLKWYIKKTDSVIGFNTSTGVNNDLDYKYFQGKDVVIKALNSGETTITIKHDDENGKAYNPLTIHVIIGGVNEPTITLNYEELSCYLGEDQIELIPVIRNIPNGADSEIIWSVDNPNQDYFIFETSNDKAFVLPNKIGQATVSAKLKSYPNVSASCVVKVKETETIRFFVYDNETTQSQKNYINMFNVKPGETKLLHWETVPPRDKITGLKLGDNLYFQTNDIKSDNGYGGYLKNYNGNSYPVDSSGNAYIGTLIVQGKSTTGSTFITVETASKRSASLTVTNDYNYLLTTDKSIIAATPKEVHSESSSNNLKIMDIHYEIRPSNAVLYIQPMDGRNEVCSEKLVLQNENYASGAACKATWVGGNNYNYWEIKNHKIRNDTNYTDIAEGTLRFWTDGEVNTSVLIYAVNKNIVTSSGQEQTNEEPFGDKIIDIKVCYQTHSFKPQIDQNYPYVYRYSDPNINNGYSYYDSTNNVIILGDGEEIKGLVTTDKTNEPYSSVVIKQTRFKSSGQNNGKKDAANKFQEQYMPSGNVKINDLNDKHDKAPFDIFHSHDYAVYQYKNQNGGYDKVKETSTEHNMFNIATPNDKIFEIDNSTIRLSVFVGWLEVTYFNYYEKMDKTYNIPIYVQVRNTLCTNGTESDNPYYKKYLGD